MLKVICIVWGRDWAAKGCFQQMRAQPKPVGDIFKISSQNQESGALICGAGSTCSPGGCKVKSSSVGHAACSQTTAWAPFLCD